MVEDVEVEAHNLNIVEREAAEVLKTSKIKQQEAIKESEEKSGSALLSSFHWSIWCQSTKSIWNAKSRRWRPISRRLLILSRRTTEPPCLHI
ncbi:hypothetical protein NL676_013387 [Syzygium grande]|nr:hypothetical protein NL676_013387 [Syzygium grande]